MGQHFEFIKIEQSEGLATLFLNRPPVNVLNISMIEEIIQGIRRIKSDPDARLLLLRGEGKCFSAGMDVADHLPDKVHTMFVRMHQLMWEIAEMEIPSISALHGSALGGGLEMAMMADFAYASANCKLGQPEINLGVFPPVAVAYFSELIGVRNANDLILTGRIISADEGHRMGLLNGVFSDADFEKHIKAVAGGLLKHSKAALKVTKHALRQSRVGFLEKLKAAEQIYLEDLMNTQDALEGLNAFLQKRPPNWRHQ
jgi:cyclohexa-1,5-dienecarbonyl-CoA hydratase